MKKARKPAVLEVTTEGLIKLPPANPIGRLIETPDTLRDIWGAEAEHEARLAGETDDAKLAEIARQAGEAAIDAKIEQMLAESERADGSIPIGVLHAAHHLVRHRHPQVLGDKISSLLLFIARQAGTIQEDRFWLMVGIHKATGWGVNACAEHAAKLASEDGTRDIKGGMETMKGAYYEVLPKYPDDEIIEFKAEDKPQPQFLITESMDPRAGWYSPLVVDVTGFEPYFQAGRWQSLEDGRYCETNYGNDLPLPWTKVGVVTVFKKV
jgi:hypothetical protein